MGTTAQPVIYVMGLERRPLLNNERTLATATILIGGFIKVHDVALLQIGARQTLGLPRRYRGSQGWQPIVELVGGDVDDRVLQAFQDAYNAAAP